MRLDLRRSRFDGGQRTVGDEVRAAVVCVRERDTAADETHRLAVVLRLDRLRADRMAVGLPPLRLVEPEPTSELRHLRPARNPVVGFPTVRCLERRLVDHRREECQRLEPGVSLRRQATRCGAGSCGRRSAAARPPTPITPKEINARTYDLLPEARSETRIVPAIAVPNEEPRLETLRE